MSGRCFCPTLGALAVLSLLCIARSSGATDPPATATTVQEVSIAADDPVLEGHGPARTLTWTADVGCDVVICAASTELDPFLRVEGGPIPAPAEDDDGGCGTTAFVPRPVGPGESIVITVAGKPGEHGNVRLSITPYPWLPSEHHAAIVSAQRDLDAAKAADAVRDFAGARRRLEAAFAAFETIPRCDELTLMQELVQAGQLAAHLGDHERAVAAFERAWVTIERALPPDHRFRARIRRMFAPSAYHVGRAEDAAQALRDAESILRRCITRDEVALYFDLYLLALVWSEIHGNEEVVRLCLEVHETFVRELGADHRDAIAALADAALHIGKGPTKDRELVERVLAAFERTLPADDPDIQKARTQLARSVTYSGDYERARQLLELVLEAFSRRPPDDEGELADVLSTLADLSGTLGDDQREIELLERQVDTLARILPAGHPRLMIARGALLTERARDGDASASLPELESLVSAFERTVPPDDPDLQELRLSLATVMLIHGKAEGVIETLERAIAVVRRRNGPDSVDVLRFEAPLAAALRDAGRIEESLAMLARIESRMRDEFSEDLPGLDGIRQNIALSNAAAARPGDARREAARGLAIVASRVERLTPGFGAEAEPAARRMMQSFLSLFLAYQDPEQDAAAARREELEAVLRHRGFVERQTLLTHLRRVAVREDEVAAATDAAATAARARFAEAFVAGRPVDEVRRHREAMEVAESALWRRVAGDVDSTPVDVRAVAADLEPNEVAVCTVSASASGRRHDATAVAFVLAASGEIVRVDLGPSEPIMDACFAFRDALAAEATDELRDVVPFGVEAPESRDRESERAVQRTSEAVGALLAPLVEALPPGTRTLRVAPHEGFAAIPWDAIRSERERFLCDRFRVRYVENLSPAPAVETGARGPPVLVLVSGVDYDHATPPDGDAGSAMESLRTQRGRFDSLPETVTESTSIRARFERRFPAGAVDSLAGALATRHRFEEAAPTARYLHVATHGIWRDPIGGGGSRSFGQTIASIYPSLLSGLAFAGANTTDERSVLTALELSALDLSRCELAVLSACHSNVGLRPDGAAVAGLNRALLIAGARTTITSLFAVRDNASALFFETFYDALWTAGRSAEDAFGEARAALRRREFPTSAWAAFVLYGHGTWAPSPAAEGR